MKKIFAFLLLVNVVFLLSVSYYINQHYKTNYIVTETRNQGNYNYINPLLECDIEYEYFNPGNVKSKLENYIEKELQKDEISTISYYYRSLKNGEYFWYNLEEEFIPASLLKIPLAMSVLKQFSLSDIHSIWVQLWKEEEVQPVRNYGKDFIAWEWNIYSLHELLREMLQNSDNVSANLLFESLGNEKVHQVYSSLGIPDFSLSSAQAEISVKKYSSFFRVLYNASYLSEEASEYILGFLWRWGFNEWIRYYIPKSITVANKFWERAFKDNDEKQIHDCGIVYVDSPYLLCVMTRGTNFTPQLEVVQNISKMVYEYRVK